MTDAEMIAWLEEQSTLCREKNALGAKFNVDAVLARLKRLTAPAEGAPIPAAALLDIRDEVALGERDRTAARLVLKLMLRDLLAAHDWQEARAVLAESALQDFLADPDSRHGAGARAGVAQALGVIRERLREADEECREEGSPLAGIAWNVLDGAMRAIESACGPGDLPPHAATYAERQRLRAALEAIADMTPATDERARTLAAEALGGRP